MKQKNIGVLVGSLRKDSYSRMVAETLLSHSPASLTLNIIEINTLPLYSEDLDKETPIEWSLLRSDIKKSDGLLFITPEYNRSIPGALKNAIDIASRPYGKNSMNAKPSGIISISTGAIGGFGANHHLRQSLVFLNSPAMQTPEAYIGKIAEIFDTQGRLNDHSTLSFLKKYMNSFEEWVTKNMPETIAYNKNELRSYKESENRSYTHMY